MAFVCIVVWVNFVVVTAQAGLFGLGGLWQRPIPCCRPFPTVRFFNAPSVRIAAPSLSCLTRIPTARAFYSQRWFSLPVGQSLEVSLFFSLVCQSVLSSRPSSAGALRPSCSQPVSPPNGLPQSSSKQGNIHIQSRSHGKESPLGSVTPFSGCQSNCLLQPERKANLTVEDCCLAFTLLSIHHRQFNSVQSNCAI